MLSSSTHLVAAGAAAVTGGVYLAFSAMVMPALRSRPAADAIATMQHVNVQAVRAPFMLVFFGGAAAAVAVEVVEVVRALTDGGLGVGTVTGLAGAALALASLVVTVVYNVPRNDLVAELDPTSVADQARWLALAREWTTANSLRGALSVLGAGLLGARVLLP